MKITNVKIPVAGAALALAFLGGVALAPSFVSAAAAQISGNTTNVAQQRGPGGVDLFQAAADFIGITVDQLRTEMGTDKSIADVAVAHGKTRDALISALQAVEVTKLGDFVDQKGLPQRGFGPGAPGMGPRVERHMQVNMHDVAATYLGISATDLQTQIRSGKTLGEIAVAAGKTKDGLIQAIVTEHVAQIDKAVTDGKLTTEQATTLKTGLTERITQMVDRTGMQGGPMMGGGGPGFGFRGRGR